MVMIGYKVMPLSDDGQQILSGANSRLSFPLDTCELSMPGNGIYLALSKEYVLDYYSGLSEREVLLTLEFNESDILSGNIEDKEPELSVGKVTIINKTLIVNL